MNQLTVIKYTFQPYFQGYFMNGNWYSKDGKLLQVKFYNGRNCISDKGKRFGIKKLRSVAQRVEVIEEVLPF